MSERLRGAGCLRFVWPVLPALTLFLPGCGMGIGVRYPPDVGSSPAIIFVAGHGEKGVGREMTGHYSTTSNFGVEGVGGNVFGGYQNRDGDVWFINGAQIAWKLVFNRGRVRPYVTGGGLFALDIGGGEDVGLRFGVGLLGGIGVDFVTASGRRFTLEYCRLQANIDVESGDQFLVFFPLN